MGQGGTLQLINGTPYDWVRTSSSTHQMNSWNLPATVPAGGIATGYVEWDQGIFTSVAKDSASAEYSLKGTSYTFQMQARAPSKNFDLLAYIDGLATTGNPQGSTINLGWKHDGTTNFILSGKNGEFSSSHPPSNWMQGSLPTIGSRQLRHLCIPGSHDAGMSSDGTHTAFANPSAVITQTNTIGGQLTYGSRFFDLRPVIAGGGYSAGHYSNTGVSPLGWQGGNGQTISSIVSDINAFTATNHELIILSLSHDYNTDTKYTKLTQAQYNALLQELSGINHLFVAPNPTTVDLTQLTMNQYIGTGKAAVIIVCDPEDNSVTLGMYANMGFYMNNQFNVYNSYSNSDSSSAMTTDQLTKMDTIRTDPDQQAFLLSWTLTQQTKEVVLSRVDLAKSILDLAAEAMPLIFSELLPKVSSVTYPNILLLDGYNNFDVAALAMAINDKINV